VIDGEPAVRLVFRTAVPVLSRFDVPSRADPLKNLTLPVGVWVEPELAGITVAVKVTGWPVTSEVGAATKVVVDAWLTFAVTAGEVLVLKLPSPA
jgi:hypothetical protein